MAAAVYMPVQAEVEAAQAQVIQLLADVADKHAAAEAQAREITGLRHSAKQQQAALEEVNVQTQQKHEQLSKTVAELMVCMSIQCCCMFRCFCFLMSPVR